MARKFIDCREFPSEKKCTVALSADSEADYWRLPSSMLSLSTVISMARICAALSGSACMTERRRRTGRGEPTKRGLAKSLTLTTA